MERALVALISLGGIYITYKGAKKLVNKITRKSESINRNFRAESNSLLNDLQNLEETMIANRQMTQSIVDEMRRVHEAQFKNHLDTHLDTIIIPH